MEWQHLDPLVMDLLKRHPAPNFILIHLGSNDLVTPGLTGKNLVEEMFVSQIPSLIY